jgi:hypothetical protein
MRSRSIFIFVMVCGAGLAIMVFGARYLAGEGLRMWPRAHANSTAGKTISTTSGSRFSDIGTVFSAGKPRVRDDHYRPSPKTNDGIDTELDGTVNGGLKTEDIVPFDVDALTDGEGGFRSFKEILSIFMGSSK